MVEDRRSRLTPILASYQAMGTSMAPGSTASLGHRAAMPGGAWTQTVGGPPSDPFGGNTSGYLDLSGLPNQMLGEIGRRLTPKVCGGGAFGFAGGQVKIPGTNVHGEVLGVVNYDSKSGISAGGIGEVKLFGPFHVGGEVAYNFRSNTVSGEGLGFLGHETASVKLGAFGGGLLASSHGDVGGYGFVGPFGGGGYATLVLADTPCKP
jgi:hypothetical protein